MTDPSASVLTPAQANRVINTLIVMVFFTYIGQFLLNAVLAPLSRSLGMQDWHMGATVSLAALMVMTLSQRWGRLSVSWGRKPVLVSALVLATIAGSLFALTTYARISGLITAGVAALGIIFARGFFFGAAVAAVAPTGQALIAEFTPTERARVKGLASFGAAFNIATITGSLLSSFLAAWWLLAPVYATPLFVSAALVIAVIFLPTSKGVSKPAKPPKVRFTDRRVLPFILAGAGMFFANGVVQITIGFILQDRYGFSPQFAVYYTGWAMVLQASGAMFAQLVIVKQLSWRPQRLLRTGLFLVFLSVASLMFSLPLWLLLCFSFMQGLGAGIGGPGYHAGASLQFDVTGQGSVAGLLHAVGGFTWIFAPFLGTYLYGYSSVLAIGLGALIVGLSLLWTWVHPIFRPAKLSPKSLKRL
ncbi:MFS transporter [Gleimia sp. 6138-11-ORH1]|uniref:MFS transporter n=1 Tax=Gleimia sp. 6138-11-ORH1 TaxID=2973937 RepID=UPI00216A8690|nr:MFS transporter [Gleimia sp. 6138-11-ORH1]MCS4485264.1 MFS transporter [Gleimia sp. 6138-11-ORH1]